MTPGQSTSQRQRMCKLRRHKDPYAVPAHQPLLHAARHWDGGCVQNWLHSKIGGAQRTTIIALRASQAKEIAPDAFGLCLVGISFPGARTKEPESES